MTALLVLIPGLAISVCPADNNSPRLPVWSNSIRLDEKKPKWRVFITPDLHDLVLLARPNEYADNNWIPHFVSLNNGIEPEVRASVSLDREKYYYRYTVGNGAGAR